MKIETNYDLTTKQGIFDHVATRLIAQGKPGYDEARKACVYRAPDGCACAAGHLMNPNDVLVPGLYGGVSNSPVLARLDERVPRDRDTIEFLGHLQEAHDYAAEAQEPFLPGFRDRMRGVAERHSLNAILVQEPA